MGLRDRTRIKEIFILCESISVRGQRKEQELICDDSTGVIVFGRDGQILDVERDRLAFTVPQVRVTQSGRQRRPGIIFNTDTPDRVAAEIGEAEKSVDFISMVVEQENKVIDRLGTDRPGYNIRATDSKGNKVKLGLGLPGYGTKQDFTIASL